MAEFEIDLEQNIFLLHNSLKNKNYQHGTYEEFKISDPKPRIIHKATISDRVIHQAIYQIIEPIFDKHFIYDSYSSRLDKGHHKAVKRLESFVKRFSLNYKKECWAIKIDIRKFFDSIDQKILLEMLKSKIRCKDTIRLLKKIIKSYNIISGKGIPLGNVTSQLFANVYLDNLDQFVKHNLKEKYYIRFCDDFIILNQKNRLFILKKMIKNFLKNNLLLESPDSKIKIRKLRSGFDFLGYNVLPYHTILRIKTKQRMFKKLTANKYLNENHFYKLMQSYLGLIKHCNSYKIKNKFKSI